jgi:hypothetical protein
MEKLGYKRSPCGVWTWSRTVEVLKAADSMPTLGSAKMDAIRQKLRKQSDSPVLGWLIAALAFLFAAMRGSDASTICSRAEISSYCILLASPVFVGVFDGVMKSEENYGCRHRKHPVLLSKVLFHGAASFSFMDLHDSL